MSENHSIYLRKKKTDEYFIWTEALAERDDMLECDVLPAVSVIKAEAEKGPAAVSEPTPAPEPEAAEDEREAIIQAVIEQLDPESDDFSKPTAFNPNPLPKVSVVSEKAGFKVSRDEIAEAIKKIKG